MSPAGARVVAQLQPVFQRFPSRRSVVFSSKGIVASSQPLATEVGLEILRKDGNAADAAVAVSAALNVTEPTSCGIGGDAFCLFFDARTREVKGLNGSGRSPRRLTLEYVRKRGISGRNIPLTDMNTVTVPGAAAAWVDTIDSFGSGTLSISEILEPAIRLAEDGVPVSQLNSHAWQRSEVLLKTASSNGHEMLLHEKAPLPGQIIKLPTLAKTFRSLAEHGRDGFYKGRIASAIVELVQSKGGVMDLEDLALHRSTLVDPIKYTYRFGQEVTVYECPPNGQGITTLLALGILDSIQEIKKVRPLLEMEHNSAEYLHTIIEAMRLAFTDSQYYVTDPDVEHVPIGELLSPKYLATRAMLFDPAKTNPRITHGSPLHSSDTVYFSVTDRSGNACSFIQSNYTGFGTGAIPAGCGFTLQNRGAGFVLEKGHPNGLQGEKRPYHTIIPAMVMRGGDLFLSYGVMGGYMQPQGHVQVLLNILRGFNAQEALDAPRFCISAGPPGAQDNQAGDVCGAVYFEDGISREIILKLRGMGHDAHSISGFDRALFGRGQVIQKVADASGTQVWAAGSDPRADGNAAPQL